MAYLIQPIEEDRCVSLSCDGEMLPREIAAARYEAHGVLSARRWSRMIVDFTRLRFFPTSPQIFDFAKGFSGQVPPDARVALVVRPEQVRDANLVEKVARKNGVFLSYFVDQGKASLWIQRSQPLRRTLGPAPWSQQGRVCKRNPTISSREQRNEPRDPHQLCTLCNHRNAATSEPGCATRQAVVAER